jgi:hypothetical protein
MEDLFLMTCWYVVLLPLRGSVPGIKICAFSTSKLSVNSTGVLVGSWLFCVQYFPCSISFQYMLGAGVEIWPLMKHYRMFFNQTSTPASMMHLKFTEHGKECMQINELPIKTPAELTDNSLRWPTFWI